MDYRPIIFIVAAIVFISCVIFYNVIIHKKDKRIADLEDKNYSLHVENDKLQKKYEETYECYMASLAREARRDGQ